MPIYGQTSLTTIAASKELKLSYQPLLLCQIVFPGAASGSNTLYLSKENLDASNGGFAYQGNNYIPRILNKNIGAIQAVSDNGITQSPQITISLADADQYLFNEWEFTYGFMGAKITVFFVFWDPGSSTFSSDTLVKFVGVCNPPNFDESSLNITCTNILNMSRVMVPTCQINQLCRWDFPANAAQREDGANNTDSNFYFCGYSPDVSGSNAVGNTSTPNQTNPDGSALTDANGIYVSCGLTWSDCILRLGNSALPTSSTTSSPVQIEQDTSGRATGRFSGIHYDPPGTYSGTAYLSGSKVQGINNPNTAKYGQYYPQIWGTCFVYPPVMQVIGDPNSTRFECVVCLGNIKGGGIEDPGVSPDPIQMVIVNDYIVPFYTSSDDPTISRWAWVSYGNRNGQCNRDAPWNGSGDPYGGLATIEVVVPAAVAASNAIPQVQVLTSGPPVRVFNSSDPTDYTMESTANGPMLLLDFLTWCGFQATSTQNDFDLQSWVDAAAVANVSVPYLNLLGQNSTHERYRLGWFLRDRRSAATVLTNLLLSIKGMLSPSSALGSPAGLLTLAIKQTLADQQPSPVYGSNDNTPRSSATGAGAAATGYVAYAFNESNILRKSDKVNAPSTFAIEQRGIYDTPNEVSISFQDEEFQYSNDSLTIDDTQHISRSGQTIGGSIATEGLQNFDQAARCIQTQLAEQFRGNPRTGNNGVNDPGGTWTINFQCSYRGVHLNIGQIISVTMAKYQLDDQWFRIIAVSPDPDAEKITIRAIWHEDDWYLDSYGQNPSPILQQQQKQALLRPPLGWAPDITTPVSGDPLWAQTDSNFSIAQAYAAGADSSSIASLLIQGKLPVNKFQTITAPPYLTAATYAPSSGALGPATYYYSICALDGSGNRTPPSWPPVFAAVTAASGAVSIPNIYWQPGTASYEVYGGTDPNYLTLQQTGTGTPSSIEITSNVVAGQQAPDVQFNNLAAYVYPGVHLGILGAAVTSVTSATLAINAIVTARLAGRVLSVIGQPNTQSPLPVMDFSISNSIAGAETTSLSISGAPDLTTLGLAGAAVVVRAQANIASANTIGDSLFGDVLVYGPQISIAGASGDPVIVETSTPHGLSTGDTVIIGAPDGSRLPFPRHISLAGSYSNVVVIDATHVELPGVALNGVYGGGGTIQQVSSGLVTNAEAGNVVRIIYGTGAGQEASVLSNTSTTLTIDGTWATIPDSTSVFVVTGPNPVVAPVATQPVTNSDPNKTVQITVQIPNFSEQSLFVQVFAQSATGQLSIPADSPFREIYVFGGQAGTTALARRGLLNTDATAVFTADTPTYTQQPDDEVISVDTTGGNGTVNLLPGAQWRGASLIIQKVSADSNNVTIVADSDSGDTINQSAQQQLLLLGDSVELLA